MAQFINEDVIRKEDDENMNQIQADNIISMNEKVDLEKQRKKEMRRVREASRSPTKKRQAKSKNKMAKRKSRKRRKSDKIQKDIDDDRVRKKVYYKNRTKEQHEKDKEVAKVGMRTHRKNKTREQSIRDRVAASAYEHTRRDNFTADQWARHRSSNRYQVYLSRLRQQAATLPEAMRCNMEIFNPSTVEYCNVGATVDWTPTGQQISLKVAAEDLQYRQRKRHGNDPGGSCICGDLVECDCLMQVAVCYKCKAIGYKGESKSSAALRLKNKSHNLGEMCCNNGKYTLPDLPVLPETLYKLFTEDTPEAKYFRKHMRMFNCGLAMGSCTFDDKTVRGGALKVCGELQRRIGSAEAPTNSQTPKCIQLYCHDPTYQAEERARRNYDDSTTSAERERIKEIYRKVQESLENEAQNTYLSSYKNMLEYIKDNNLNPEELSYELHATDKPPDGHHIGRYHLPNVSEIAMLLPSTVQNNAERTIVCSVRQRSDDQNILQFIQHHHRSYAPLIYPLLFPHGTDGWRLNMWSLSEYNSTSEGISSNKIQFAPYSRFYLVERVKKFNHLIKANRLYQQWIVDTFSRMEMMRLQWIRNNQRTIRAELYGSLRLSAANNSVENSGVSTILPASHTGSDRWYHSAYSDAMALVRIYGKPDFFITFTFNVQCPEVKAELEPGQDTFDRPDILCRVFNQKRNEFLKEIQGGVLGEYKAHVSVIEFQKRGAPHAHTLVWLKNFDHSPQNVDNVISAEIPPRGEEGSPERDFYDLVMKFMIHGPCSHNRNLGCVKDGKPCSKDFPKEFSSTTTAGDETYVKPRRRTPSEGGNVGLKYINGAEVTVDNRWVVPYNPYFLLKYRSHINVENCNAVQAVKYLFLYHFKGEDMVTIEDEDMYDEVKKFSTRRYVSSCFGYWRLVFPDNMVSMYPPVKKLKIHLENQQRCVYEPTQRSAEEALSNNERTMLTAYFEANESDDEQKRLLANDLLYEDFPAKFVYKEGVRRWEIRQRGPAVTGRILPVHPGNQELFYLRVLLKNVRGATSFKSLRTIKEGTPEEKVCETNKQACVERGLCEDDTQWREALAEGAQIKRPKALRYCFANILLHCWPVGPRELFDEFAHHLSEDYTRKRRQNTNLSEDDIRRYARNDLLRDLNDILKEQEKTNEDFNIDMPEDIDEPDVVTDNADQIDDNALNFFNENYPLMEKNAEQKEIFDEITECINTGKGGLYNIDAPGGSGKTFLSNLLLSFVRKEEDIAIAAAMSGIASTLMTLATTFHKRFGCPIPCFDDSTSKHRLNSNEALLIKKAKLIIIDEVSMMHYKQLEMLDRFLKELMKTDEYMGGKLIIIMHDFRQILPVVPGGSRAMISASSIIHSVMWNSFKTLHLTRNMRVEKMRTMNTDPTTIAKLEQHSKWLLSIGDGTIKTAVNNIMEIPSHMVCKDKEELESKVYDNFLNNYNNKEYLEKRAIMSGTNDTIQQCNYEMIKQIPGDEVISTSLDMCMEEKDQQQYDVDFLNRINASGMAPHRLMLKKGACIILIKNLNVNLGHCNGSRYIIKHVTNRIIHAQKLGGGEDSEILIPRIPTISKETSFPVPFKRIQFPVLGAYYLTFNRAQGQSLDRSGLYLPESVFSHGHLYVGFSRNGNPDTTYAYADQTEFENVTHLLDDEKVYTRNIVFKEVLET